MIAKISKVPKDDSDYSSDYLDGLRSYSYNLPLFETHLDSNYRKEMSEYVIQFWWIEHKCRYPAWIKDLNQDQLNLINSYWNMAIEQDKDGIEFEV